MPRLRPLVLALTMLALAATSLTLVPAARPSASSSAAAASAVQAARATAPATQFRVSTFNVLGHSHTAPGGDRKGWASGRTRMVWASDIIKSKGLDLVGFQEFEAPQYKTFQSQMGSSWAIYPTTKDGYPARSNSIAWKTSVWTAVRTSTFKSVYFKGRLEPRPLVLLRNNATGQLVRVLNTHNAANTYGDAKAHRDKAERIQAALVNKLRAARPDIPVMLLGDMNDRRDFYCPMTYLTELEAADGGTHGDPPDGSCTPPTPTQIDWIMGTRPITFSGYTLYRDALVKKTTDHPVIWADASIPAQPARTAGVKRVVVVDIQGLPSRWVSARRMPTLHRLRQNGAATLHARTAAESSTAVPNTISILTGRRVTRSAGGHGVTSNRSTSGTVADRARTYAWSVFDVAHNLGLTTSFFSGDPRAKLVAHSWGVRHGAADTYGKDNGRRKISVAKVSRTDGPAVRAARARLASKPTYLTVVQLGAPERVARKKRPGSRAQLAAVQRADRQLRTLLETLHAHAATATSTMMIVTSSTSGLTDSSRWAVPLVVSGPGVAAGNLYSLNPQLADPGTARGSYSGKQPVRTGMVANLVATALRLPPVPGSSFDPDQRLRVFADPGPGRSR